MQRGEGYRELFQGIDVPVQLADGSFKQPINFDNGATTPPFNYVGEVIDESIGMYGAIHRAGQKSIYSTENYEQSKLKVLNFLGVSPEDGYCVVYTKNTTEGMNLLAYGLCHRCDAKVLSTRMEHHSNDLPWRKEAKMFYIEVDEKGFLKLEELEEKLRCAGGTIHFVTVTAASNVTGYINPIHKMAQVVHQYGAKLIVDAAQLIAHYPIQMKGSKPDEDIDFLVFSAHKMYAPFGVGVVVGKHMCMEQCIPYVRGGGGVSAVMDDDVYYKESPDKEEAGTPNYFGVMALSAAIDMLESIGMNQVVKHEQRLKNRMLSGLRSMPKVILYGDPLYKARLGVVSFNVAGMHHSLVNQLLSEQGGIAVRNGCFCAQPYVARLLGVSDKERYELMLHPERPQPGMVRASFGLYNTDEEVDEFL
ncbi:MAG: aminotransferase class V-fold PLP-dependent enzyme, partial [Niameybacter sp.]